MKEPLVRTGSAHGPDDPPGFPTSAPYHTKDVLSPTAAPWATPIPRAAPASAPAPAPSASATPATSTPEAPGPSPGLSLGLGSSLGAGGLGGGLGLGGSRGAASGGYLAGGFGPAMGGAGGGMPAPGSVPPPPSGPRRAPEAVIDAGQPRMPRPLQVALPSGAGAGAQGAGAGETGAGGAGTGAEGGQEGADGACGGAATAAAAGPVVFRPATKRIATAEDLKRFLEGNTVKELMAFILAINEAVRGKKANDTSYSPSPAVQAATRMLATLSELVDQVPPEQQSLRYGNPAFRTWSARLAELAPALLAALLPPPLAAAGAATELLPYLLDSFGNATRIDYGTGHETCFCALLYCLARLGVFGEGDAQGLGLVVFKAYLELMRKIQTTYWLEPAGSHGVWGLDDYQFLPFVWGSAQLAAHPIIKPRSIHNPDVLEAYGDAYLYLGCVAFVKQVKKGPLGETSPMLNDISSVPTWAKVNSGMIKMYQVEVLSKFPIMQHFLFGSLLPFE